jgi:hypothetical protein
MTGADSQKNMNRNSRNTIEMPTGIVFAPPGDGVSVSTAETMIMQMPMPTPPAMRRTLRPKRSMIQMALRVKMIPNVALSALMRAIWPALVNTFWYIFL